MNPNYVNQNDLPEEMDISQSARLLTEAGKDQPEIPMCGFLSVQYYQPYFDVDTMDIVNRTMHAVFFCRREQNFLSLIGEKPDAYGPFWIATTLVFAVAVSSHLSGWLTSWLHGLTWAYNFQTVLTASSVIYGYAFLAPCSIWFVFRQYEPKLKFVTMFCLYGYSIFLFIPAVLICIFPSPVASWITLLIAAFISGIFLLRNLAPFIVVHAKKHAAILLGFVGCVQLSLMLSIKFYFFYSTS